MKFMKYKEAKMEKRERQNLRVKKVCERLGKKITYKELSAQQVKYIKLKKCYDEAEKELNFFYRNCKRTDCGMVDWNALNDSEIELFECLNRKHGRLFDSMSKMEDSGFDADSALRLFGEINNRSVAF